MSAFDSIVARRPRENAGPMASNRFAYQFDWGLSKLLSLEESGQPYTIIFDYHDDILILDSDESPNYIDFYQVKTTSASEGWTKSSIIAHSKKKESLDEKKEQELFDDSDEETEEDSKYSKIAKLLVHSLVFSEARDFFFVTNANFGKTLIERKHNRTQKLDFADLVEKAKESIKQKIKEELPSVKDEVFDHLHFIKNQMSVNDHQRTIIGYLNEFLATHYPKANVGAKPVYDTLIGEIRKRNDYEIEPYSVDDLLKHKAFTRQQFHQFLKGLEAIESLEAKRASIMNVLTSYLPATASSQRRSIIKQLQAIREETLVYDNNEFHRLYNYIFMLLDKTESNDCNEWDWSQKVLEHLHKEFDFIKSHSDDFLTCLILYEIC